jgi:hypothetical protein
MRDLPKSADECDKKKDTHFIVLTGWKNQYNIVHPRYHVSSSLLTIPFFSENPIFLPLKSR